MNDSTSVIRGPAGSAALEPGAVTIGVFDGVHRGHRHLIGEARAQADGAGLPLTVLTFDPHPLSVVRPELEPCRLATLEHRIRLLGEAGADHVRVVTFDADLAALPAAEFVAEYLVGDLSARLVVTGDNFRFGNRAAGDVDLLAELGQVSGFRVDAVPLATDESAAWSSTRIREMIRGGDVSGAEMGLVRPHRVEGTVVPGDRRGRELGYRTANVDAVPGTCLPADGVYAGWAVLAPDTEAETLVPAAISVGANVTFGGTRSRVEAHLLGSDEWDLYDQYIGVDFTARIRGMVAFPSVDDLLTAMAGDVLAARRLLAE